MPKRTANEEQRLPVDYDCPCCGKRYTAHVIAHWGQTSYPSPNESVTPFIVDSAQTAAGETLPVCERCHQPCCPNCEYVAGQMFVCTRCTTYPCTHASL